MDALQAAMAMSAKESAEPMFHMTGTVNDISDADLLRRAVTGARSNSYGRRKHPRWVAVAEQLALGSTYATQLCLRFGLDPDEQVKR